MSGLLSGPGWRRFLSQSGLTIGLVLLVLCGSFLSPVFFTADNLVNVLRQAAFLGIIACAMTYVIVLGEIDVSVGSLVAFSSALLGVLYGTHHVNLGLSCALVLLVGVLSGLLVGVTRIVWQVPSFISTLALYLAFRGLAQSITSSMPIAIYDPVLSFLGKGELWGVPVQALAMLIAFGLFYFVARKTVFGRALYAVGGNARASRLAGLPVDRVRITAFVLSGLLAALVGILLSARLEAGNANIANGMEFEVIAAVIVGGTSLAGGRGGIVGTLLGVLFVTLLSNLLILTGVDPYIQDVVRGAVVLLAVLLANIQRGTKERD